MATKWNKHKRVRNKSKLARKTFYFTVLISFIYIDLIYFLIYFGLPTIYRYYNQINLTTKINSVISKNTTFQELDKNIKLLQQETHAVIELKYDGKSYECRFQYSGCFEKQYEYNEEFKNRKDIIYIEKNIMVDGNHVDIAFIYTISPQSEVQGVLVWFLPIFGIFSIILAALISYIISIRYSRGIILLNKNARKIASLDFDIQDSIQTNDELGELSATLVQLSNHLETSFDELKQTNEKLNDEFEKERTKEEERRAYIAALSHDLKTPLTAIKGQLEGMLYNVGKYKDREKYLQANLTLVNEMDEIVQSILFSSKLDDYDLKLNITEVNVRQIVEHYIAENEYSISKKNVIIKQEYLTDTMMADASLIKLVFSNLIGNAIVYADDNSEITIRLNKNNFVIKNKVSEFNEDNLKDNKLLKPFYRGDKSRNKKGSGLGLYISDKICRLHNIDLEYNYLNKHFIITLTFNNQTRVN